MSPLFAAMGKVKTRRKGLIFRPEVLLQFYGKEEFVRGWRRLLPHMEPEDKQKILKELLTTLTPEELLDKLTRQQKEEIKRRLD
jgi:hypothetical protein